jgi:hypothetical protein
MTALKAITIAVAGAFLVGATVVWPLLIAGYHLWRGQ